MWLVLIGLFSKKFVLDKLLHLQKKIKNNNENEYDIQFDLIEYSI